MATLLSLKRRIKTAQNVSKTTKAMQMIAASKLKKAQNAALLSRAYVDKLSELTKGVAEKVEEEKRHPFMKTPNGVNKILLIVVAPDKGLAGGLVSNVNREVFAFDSKYKNASYLTVGKKAEHAIASLNKEIIASFPFGTTLPHFEMVYPIRNLIEENFLNRKISEVVILFTNFQSVFTQVPKTVRILPVSLPENKETEYKQTITLFEPNLMDIVPTLLERYMEMVLYQSFLESYASEQAARMIAMKNATDNALDIIDELKLEYNKQRQEKITNEILDISSASFSIGI